MKHTITNFPKQSDFHNLHVHSHEAQRWAEESEKELKETIIHIQTIEIVKIMKENPDNHVDVAFQAGRVSAFKEILEGAVECKQKEA